MHTKCSQGFTDDKHALGVFSKWKYIYKKKANSCDKIVLS